MRGKFRLEECLEIWQKGIGDIKRLCRDAMAHASTKNTQDYVISTGVTQSLENLLSFVPKEVGWNQDKEEGIVWEEKV